MLQSWSNANRGIRQRLQHVIEILERPYPKGKNSPRIGTDSIKEAYTSQLGGEIFPLRIHSPRLALT